MNGMRIRCGGCDEYFPPVCFSPSNRPREAGGGRRVGRCWLCQQKFNREVAHPRRTAQRAARAAAREEYCRLFGATDLPAGTVVQNGTVIVPADGRRGTAMRDATHLTTFAYVGVERP